MKLTQILLATATAGALLPGAALAQVMPGMPMPSGPAAPPSQASTDSQPRTQQQDGTNPHAGHEMAGMGQMPGMDPGNKPGDRDHPHHPEAQPQSGDHHAGHDMTGQGMEGMAGMDHAGHAGHHVMRGAFGRYSGGREASGTSWQPDVSPHDGLHGEASGWSLMAHGTVDLVYDNQSGPRGDDKLFVIGHIMGIAARDLSPNDRLQFRLAVTPDPFMGPRGYPLLFATGETANGRTQLIDRQHPHDLVSELSASISHQLSGRASLFLFYGVVGDPAFGPPAYIHRLSIQDDPEAPISHHWLDSTHGTQGVITAGLVLGTVKLDVSRFRGREPDQHRYDIEAPKFDSTAARVSWNPTRTLALQASYAYQVSPEQVTPDQNQKRISASAIYTRPIGEAGYWSTTFAWGRRIDQTPGERDRALDAFVLESAVHPDEKWTVFARGERVDNDELLPAAGDFHGPAFTVGKVSVGAIRDFRLIPGLRFGVGGLVSRTFAPSGLAQSYGGDRTSGTAFVRLKLG